MKIIFLLTVLICWYVKNISASNSDPSSGSTDIAATRRNALDKGFIRLGRNKPHLRVARSDELYGPDDTRFGQHGDAFLRLGKRAPQYYPIEAEFNEGPLQYKHWPFAAIEDPEISDMDMENFIRLGRANGFMRLGRSVRAAVAEQPN